MSVTIESDLKEILARFESKLDNLQKDFTELKLEVTKDLTEIKTKVSNLEKDVADLKGTQKAQVWAIISLLGIAVLSPFLRALFSIIPFNNP